MHFDSAERDLFKCSYATAQSDKAFCAHGLCFSSRALSGTLLTLWPLSVTFGQNNNCLDHLVQNSFFLLI